MSITKHLFFLVVISSLSACASLNKEECQQADWYDIGYHDGKSGYKVSRLSDHRQACAEHHIYPDKMRYKQGYNLGLIHYCTPENALQTGLAGNTYQGICPHEAEKSFLKKYYQGKAIYDLSNEIDKHHSRISSVEYILKRDKKKNKLTTAEIRAYKNELIELKIRIEEKQKHLYYMKGKADSSLYN
ncbi:MAG: DUF2799 domain-containing protein [gamma proteobacterium symbiont of Taylorina sp.]|nr:DUF2799 domain-containing protein [gamma proteobacterium symbiont of Taylorina sp.]